MNEDQINRVKGLSVNVYSNEEKCTSLFAMGFNEAYFQNHFR